MAITAKTTHFDKLYSKPKETQEMEYFTKEAKEQFKNLIRGNKKGGNYYPQHILLYGSLIKNKIASFVQVTQGAKTVCAPSAIPANAREFCAIILCPKPEVDLVNHEKMLKDLAKSHGMRSIAVSCDFSEIVPVVWKESDIRPLWNAIDKRHAGKSRNSSEPKQTTKKAKSKSKTKPSN